MQGTIVSIVEHYGFISADNESYYFNKRSMAQGQDYAELGKGDWVTFTPAATPKGMAAKDLSKQLTVVSEAVGTNFVITRDDHSVALNGLSYQLTPITSAYFRSPSEAKNNLIHLVQQTDANVITNLEKHEATFNEGNYYYTMHAWSGLAGVYTTPVHMPADYNAAGELEFNARLMAATAEKIQTLATYSDKQRARQVNAGNVWNGIKIVLFIVWIPIAIMLAVASAGRFRRW